MFGLQKESPDPISIPPQLCTAVYVKIYATHACLGQFFSYPLLLTTFFCLSKVTWSIIFAAFYTTKWIIKLCIILLIFYLIDIAYRSVVKDAISVSYRKGKSWIRISLVCSSSPLAKLVIMDIEEHPVFLQPQLFRPLWVAIVTADVC